jgi:hypothetical protein
MPDHCSLCKTPQEDFHHILRCHHPTRTKWRTKMLASLQKQCYALKTDPTLLQILLTGITDWLHDTPPAPTDYPPQYETLIREQSTIGWNQIFQGRVSNRWRETQQAYYDGSKTVSGRDGASWVRKTLGHFFTHWNLLWDSRNDDLHGKDATSKAKAAKDQAIRELELLYSLRDEVLQRDTALFYASLVEHKSKPSSTIRQWINTYRPLILQSTKEAKDKSILHVRPITSYFGAS